VAIRARRGLEPEQRPPLRVRQPRRRVQERTVESIIVCHDLTHSSSDYVTVQQAENAGLLLGLGLAQSYTHPLLALQPNMDVACEVERARPRIRNSAS
jgi:hypothetical protein